MEHIDGNPFVEYEPTQLNQIIKRVRQKTQARAGEICGKLRVKIAESKNPKKK